MTYNYQHFLPIKTTGLKGGLEALHVQGMGSIPSTAKTKQTGESVRFKAYS